MKKTMNKALNLISVAILALAICVSIFCVAAPSTASAAWDGTAAASFADYRGDATMPKEAFDAIKGTDKTIDLISEGITWRFEGSDITEEIKDIDLKVEIQKVEEDSSVSGDAIEDSLNGNPGVVMKFPENGTLPGKATIQVKVDYAMREYLGSDTGLSVYYYNNQTGELELIASDLKVINDTYVEFPITHCSYYVLTNPNGSNSGTTPIGVAVDKTNFPDDNFRAWILEQDYGKDGLLTTEELSNVTWIEVQEKNIKDLTGVEHFTALQYLYCYDNQLTSLDVSRNTALINLTCAGNQLTSLNVGKCTALTELRCHVNQLTSLDITGCTALKQLDCDSNLLTSLDVSQNTELSWLNCGNNLLTSLNLNGNKALAELTCCNNQLTNLTVSDCIALTFLDCDNNQLTSLDLSKNIALTSLFCYENQLKELDMSGNPALKILHCYENQLTKLNIRNNAVLDSLGCNGNQLTELDVSQNTALLDLACGINQIESLDVRNCIKLEALECDNNKITELDLTANTMLTELSCDTNLLTVLDLSKNTKLKLLQCCSNQLACLNLSNNPDCTDIMAHSNRQNITVNANNEFDLSKLQGFDVSKAIDWSGCTVSNGVLTALSRNITYSYRINSSETEMFTLQVKNYDPSAVKMEGQWGDLYWNVDGRGNLTISGTGEMLHYSDPNGDPDNSNPAIDGYPWHKYQDMIETVTVEDGVTTLAERAFHGLKKLQRVELPGSLTAIGDAAFVFCPVLESMEIPAKVTFVGKEVFYECTGLKTITFTGDAPAFDPAAFGAVTLNAYYPAGNKTWTEDVRKDYGGQITWISMSTSGICGDNLTWTYSGGTLTISGTGAMYDYSQDQTNPAPWNHLAGDITVVVIEDGATSVGDYAFYNCENLEEVFIPQSLTTIGDYGLRGRLYIDQTVRQWYTVEMGTHDAYFPHWDGGANFRNDAPIIASGISGKSVFWELNENGTMEFFGTGDMYEFWATASPYYELPIRAVVIGEGITNIGMNIFEVMETDPLAQAFESITVASTVKRVEEMAFAHCKALKTITFAGDAPTFGENCFRDVTATAYYPAGNDSWTNSVMLDYEGNISWEAYCLSHRYGDWVVETEATCAEDGLQKQTCLYCEDAQTQVIPATGHSYSNWTLVTEATCTADGLEKKTCSVCGDEQTQAIPSTGHSYSDWTLVTEATCTADGLEKKTCGVCGDEQTQVIPATGHSYGDWIIVREATANEAGEERRDCEHCDHYETREIPVQTVIGVPAATAATDTATGKPKISWKAVENATGYEIYRSQNGGYECIGTTEGLSYIDKTATTGNTHYYKVKAVSDEAESELSGSVKALCKLAQPKVSVSANTKTGKNVVKWGKISGASKYQVYRATSKTGSYKLVKTTTSTSYTDTDAKAGKNYYYKVRAIFSDNTKANSAYSSVVNRCCDLPKPVVSITRKNGDPKLSWKKVSGATKYRVYRATSKNGTYKLVKTTTKTGFTDTKVKAGKTYYYKVRAVHKVSAATSAYSSVKYIKAK